MTDETKSTVKVSIPEFIDSIINGPGGFRVMESREFACWPNRDVAIAEFVIRCLTNVSNPAAESVLNAIQEQREVYLKTRMINKPVMDAIQKRRKGTKN